MTGKTKPELLYGKYYHQTHKTGPPRAVYNLKV